MISSKNMRKASVKQVAQRQLFASAVLLLRPFSTIIQMGFKQKARRAKKPPFSMAMKIALRHAVVEMDGVRMIDHARLMLSDGALESVHLLEVHRDQHSITVQYKDDARGYSINASEDEVLLCAYHQKEERVLTNTKIATRLDSKVCIAIPPDLRNEELHLYLLVHSWDKRKWARSIYAGAV